MAASCGTGFLLHVHREHERGVHRPHILHDIAFAALRRRFQFVNGMLERFDGGLEHDLGARHEQLGPLQRQLQIIRLRARRWVSVGMLAGIDHE